LNFYLIFKKCLKTKGQNQKIKFPMHLKIILLLQDIILMELY